MEQIREVLTLYRELGVKYLEIPASSQPVQREEKESLEDIGREILACRNCPLHRTRQRCVPGEGALRPPIMFIGEGPGAEEDRSGRPFVGRAGKLLDRLIQKTGHTRGDFFIGNIVKCRPPSNRNPRPEEIQACLPYLRRQIRVIRPGVIVCLGKVALNSLLATDLSIMKNHGRLFEFAGIPLVPTIHPSYILHKSGAGREAVSKAKWMMWNDIQVALNTVQGK